MGQDRNQRNIVNIEGFDLTNGPRKILKKDPDVNDAVFLYIKGPGDGCVPDFIQSPVTMISYPVKEVFSMYEDGISFKRVYITDLKKKFSYRFYIPFIPEMDSLSDNVERFPDGREKKVILDKKKCMRHHVFFIKDSITRRPVVSLAVLESMLRRNVKGIDIKEVEVK